MNKAAAIRGVIAVTANCPVIFTTGYACRIARSIANPENHFYMTGSMGLASSIGIGVALAAERTTVVVDGDGALLMNPVGLLTAGAMPTLPLVHIVLDDGQYASTGGQEAAPNRADFCALAKECGYLRVHDVNGLEELVEVTRSEVSACSAPVFIRVALNAPDSSIGARIDEPLSDHAERFSAYVVGSSSRG